MNPLPKRLRKEPLIEVLWQLQFQGNQGVGDLLSGILFSQLKKEHPQIEWRRLAAADIPAPIAQSDPNLRFAPKMLMEAPTRRLSGRSATASSPSTAANHTWAGTGSKRLSWR